MVDNFDPLTSPAAMGQAVAVISALFGPDGKPLAGGTRRGLGTTKGGGSIDVSPKWRDAEYDGKRHVVAGTSVITSYNSSMSATYVEFSEKMLGITLPGSETAAGVTTPIDANLALAVGDYLQLPWFQIPRNDGTFVVFEFDLGLVVEWPIDTKDMDDANMKIKINAVVDPNRVGYRSSMPDFRRFIIDANGDVVV